MPKVTMRRIRELIRLHHYDMSAHAMDEMGEDNLDILDIEETVLNGSIARIEKDDPRGTKYVIEGLAVDQVTPIGIVGRFTSSDWYLIITVYEITEED